jgi:hypothetical protein
MLYIVVIRVMFLCLNTLTSVVSHLFIQDKEIRYEP